MAILVKKQVIGKLGQMVIRPYRKKTIAQSMPGKGMVKQTEETKKAAGMFGQASTLGATLRHLFKEDTIRYMHDGEMTARLTKTLRAILGHCNDADTQTYTFQKDSFETLNGFDFNLSSPLHKSMWKLPESELSEGELKITLPELKIHKGFMFPKLTNKCTVYLSLLVHDLETGQTSFPIEHHSVEVNTTQDILENESFSFNVPDGCLCMIGLSLRFYKTQQDKGIYNTKLFNPSGIFGAFVTPGTFKNEDKWAWKDNFHSTIAFGKSATTDPASLH